MSELMSFRLADGKSVIVEVDVAQDGTLPAGFRDGSVIDAGTTFRRHLSSIRDAASEALRTFQEGLNPDEVKLKFGVKLTAAAGAVLARTSVDGTLEIELLWKRSLGHETAASPE